jgi:hypothetical protein
MFYQFETDTNNKVIDSYVIASQVYNDIIQNGLKSNQGKKILFTTLLFFYLDKCLIKIKLLIFANMLLFGYGYFHLHIHISLKIQYSLRSILLFTNIDVSRYILMIDISILVKNPEGLPHLYLYL